MERNIYVGTPKYNEGQRVFLLKVTLPLVRKDGDELVVCGTSTDFQYSGYSYIGQKGCLRIL